jgi:hypothetical protein
MLNYMDIFSSKFNIFQTLFLKKIQRKGYYCPKATGNIKNVNESRFTGVRHLYITSRGSQGK